VPQLATADPALGAVPVVLGEHHQYCERLGELLALVRG
jgi:hypothetical protein